MFSSAKIDSSFINKLLLAAGIFSILVVALFLLIKISHILLILFMGVLLAVILDMLMTFLIRLIPMSRYLAFTIVAVFLLGLFFVAGILIGPGIIDQMVSLWDRLPQAYDNIKEFLTGSRWGNQLLKDLGGVKQIMPPLSAVLGGISGIFSTTFGAIMTIFIVFFLGIYLSLQPAYYIEKSIKIIPLKYRDGAEEILHMCGRALRWWFFGRFLSMLIIGVFMGVGLAIAGIPFAVALGLIAAIMCFVPYIGPILSAIPPILVAMTIDMQKVLYAVIVYLIAQVLESYIITPIIQRRAVLIPPAFLFTAQIVMGVIAGILGIILATPLAVIFIILVQKIYIHDILGDSVRILGDHRRK